MNQRQARIVEAIRADRLVGHNTCSVIDECYTDEELIARWGSLTPAAAIRAARQHHHIFHEVNR